VPAGPERETVLERVETDRREQLGRVQAVAERRVERRQGLGGDWGQKLLDQARALRDRLGQQLGRVREWVATRFPEVVERIRQSTQGLFTKETKPAPAAPSTQAEPIDWQVVRARGRAASDGWREARHQRQAQAERAAQEKLERQKTVEQFQDLASSRRVRAFGYTDRSKNWRATPEALREEIDQFNALSPKARQRELDRLGSEPSQRPRLQQLQQLMDQREHLVKSLDRGLGL
jgi:hypothetical protein